MSELTKIELTPERAEKFLKFLEYEEYIDRLIKGRVFDLTACKAILHFDGGGRLQRITTEVTTFRELKEKDDLQNLG